MRRSIPMATLACSLLISLAGSAQAATKVVYVGSAGNGGGVFSLPSPAELNAFSLKQVTIHAGDSIKWVINGFHTVTFNKKGGGDIPLAGPDPAGTAVSGVTDSLSSPFWFNGLPRIVWNREGVLPQGGKAEDGSALTGSGFSIFGGDSPPYTLTFPKPGVYHYECVLHQGMQATVRVVATGRAIPSATVDHEATLKLLAAAAKTAKQLEKYTPPATTTNVSGGHDKGQVALLRYFPSRVRIPVGGTVHFSVTSPTEPHTFAFGPAAYLYLLAADFIVPSPRLRDPALVFNPQLFYPSDKPPLSYGGTAHGNGFFNAGLLQKSSGPVPPSTQSITFTRAGTYSYFCLIHPFMRGTVVVG